MKRTQLASLTLFVAFLATSPFSSARVPDALRQTLEETNSRYVALFKARDFDGLQELMKGVTTPDFKVLLTNGKSVSLGEWLSQNQAILTLTRTVNAISLRTDKLDSHGDKATADLNGTMALTLEDASGQTHTLWDEGTYRETWIKSGKDWKASRLETLTEKSTMDGQPINPNVPLPLSPPSERDNPPVETPDKDENPPDKAPDKDVKPPEKTPDQDVKPPEKTPDLDVKPVPSETPKPPPAGDSAEADKTALRDLYARISSAGKSRNFEAVTRLSGEIIDPGFVLKTSDGKSLNREEWLSGIKTDLSRLQSISDYEITPESITVLDDSATVASTTRMNAVVNGPDGKTHEMGTRSAGLDTWARTPKGWKLRQIEIQKAESSLDGKPVNGNPTAPPPDSSAPSTEKPDKPVPTPDKEKDSDKKKEEAAVRKEMEGIYEKAGKTVQSLDLDSIEQFVKATMTDDYTTKTPDGAVQTREEWWAGLKQNLTQLKSVSEYTMKLDTLDLKGDTADALVTSRFVATVLGSDGMTHDLVSVENAKDYWTKTAKGWKIKSTDSLKADVTLDGKPLTQ